MKINVFATWYMVLVPAALAAGADVSAPGTPLSEALSGVMLNTVLPVAVSLIGGLVALVLAKLRQKLNIQIAKESDAWIQQQAEAAVQMVAEKAAARLKYNTMIMTKNQKLDMALAALLAKVPAISKEQADSYIHAALARIAGVGATGDKSLRAQ
ncbi:MAG TPA: hypothetical protein VLH56_13470 [Dissulfurispiraceae bacterium]|nr:hypothetical protein [Dissulfurispiraceae bacterium]